MDNQEKLNRLRKLPHEADVHELMLELLPRMGYEHVTLTHERGNTPEFGKDLVGARKDSIEGTLEWTAFVVKHGRISGQSGVVDEVEKQINECFKYPWKSLKHGTVRISKVKVVTNDVISHGAQLKILQELVNQPNVKFWEDALLAKHIDTYHPNYWIHGSQRYRQYAEHLLNKTSLDKKLKSFGVTGDKVQRIIESIVPPTLTEWILDEEGRYTTKRREPHSIINIPANSLIVGDAGSGKTTLIERLVEELLQQNAIRNNVELYPVIVRFKELMEHDYQLDRLVQAHFDSAELTGLNIDGKEIIEKNDCVIFIDALDEIGEDEIKARCLKAVADFRKSHPDISLYCTSRDSDFVINKSQELGFRYMRLNNLSHDQISRYIDSYFSFDTAKCDRLRKSLRDSEILDKMPKTPLTLTLITIIFDETGYEIPATISDLYGIFVQILLGGFGTEGVIEMIDAGVKIRVLCHVAHHYHQNSIQSLDRDQLSAIIDKFSKERGHTYRAEDLLDDVVSKSGLLYKNERNGYQFKHQSFQEYFTAYEYYHYRQQETADFIGRFNMLWWQNVAVFYAGMSKDAPALIDKVLNASVPKTILEMMHNTAGLGLLTQALYNSPLPERKAAIIRSLENTTNAIEKANTDGEAELALWSSFSRFQIFQILATWFQHHHWSITLQKPLLEIFDDISFRIEKGEVDEASLAVADFHAYLIASMLTNPTIGDQGHAYLRYLDYHRTEDVVVDALIDHNHGLIERNPEARIVWNNETIEKRIRKIRARLNKIPRIFEFVNLSVKEIRAKLLQQKAKDLPAGDADNA